MLVDEVNLKIRHVRPAAQKIMPDEPLKIEGRGGSRIGLDIDNLWNGFEIFGHFTCHLGCLLQRCSFIHINDDLEFILVVKGKHLDDNALETKHGKSRKQENHDADEKRPPPECVMNEGTHNLAIKPCQGRFLLLFL